MKSDGDENEKDCHACKNKEARRRSSRLGQFIANEASTIPDQQNQQEFSPILCD